MTTLKGFSPLHPAIRKSREYCIWLSIILVSMIMNSCSNLTSEPEIDIIQAISQTQTAVVQKQPIIQSPVPKITPSSIAYGNQLTFSNSGINFNYDTAIISKADIQIIPSTDLWLPFHLSLISTPSGKLAGGVPDYFKFAIESAMPQPLSNFQSYLMIKPAKNADDQYFAAYSLSKTLTSDLDKLQSRLKEHSTADRFFDSNHLEVQRGYLKFQNGFGVRYITSISIDNKPTEINNQTLAYVYEGLTSDNRNYIEMVLGISAPSLKENQINNADQQRYDQDKNTYSEYVSKIDWQLKMLKAGDFIPELSKLDAIVESLLVQPIIAAPTPGGTTFSTFETDLGKPDFKDDFQKPPDYIFLGKDTYTQSDVKDGNFILSSLTENADRWRLVEKPYLSSLGDIYIRFTARSGDACSSKDGYGMLIHSIPSGSDYNSGYVFGISCDGNYRIYKMNRGNYIEIRNWTANPAILSGPQRTNKIGIMARGESYDLYVNDVLIDQFQDVSFPRGAFGFMISSPTTFNFKVYLDDLTVWNLFAKTVAVPTPTSVASSLYEPLELAQCEALQLGMEKMLKVSMDRSEYPFLDPIDTAARGKSCHIEFQGNGEQVGKDALLQSLAIFEKLQWRLDKTYSASGPEGEQGGYRKSNNELAIVKIGWKPADSKKCSPNTPIGDCLKNLQPSQIIFTITIDAAQRMNQPATSQPPVTSQP